MQALHLFLAALYATTASAQQLCFVRADSTDRRDAVAVANSTSQIHCNIRCIDTPGCDACMYYSQRGKCVMLGQTGGSTFPGTCPAPYTSYERRSRLCPVCPAPPAVDFGYTPSVCTQPSDVLGMLPPGQRPCGVPKAGDRRIVIDAIAHDGARLVLENYVNSTIEWDPSICSWYYKVDKLDGQRDYFASAKCIRIPLPPHAPGCGCKPLPTARPLPGFTLDASPQPLNDVAPACPDKIQVYYKRVPNSGSYQKVYNAPAAVGRSIFCAMGEWMFLLDNGELNHSVYSIVAATCVV